MKIVKPIIFILVLTCVSYAALWYGFAKGYESSQSLRLAEAAGIATNLYALREGNSAEVIESLELQLDLRIIQYHNSDKDFIKYIAGIPKPDGESDFDQNFINYIVKYRESTSYKCTVDKEICKLVRDTLYGNK